jgi:hypothetical protein
MYFNDSTKPIEHVRSEEARSQAFDHDTRSVFAEGWLVAMRIKRLEGPVRLRGLIRASALYQH